MRIFSSSIWVLSTLLFNNAIADDPTHNEEPSFIFDGTFFNGDVVAGNQTSVFEFEDLKNNVTTFKWIQEGGEQVAVLQVDLMSNDSKTIASWCSPGERCEPSDGFSVTPYAKSGDIQLASSMSDALSPYLGQVLFFRLDWRLSAGVGGANSSWSQAWAVANGPSQVSSVYEAHAYWMTAGGSPVSTPGPAPTTTTSAAFSGTAASVVATSTSAPGNSSSKSRGLTTGAIVGIVVGCVGGVILVSVVAGCLCFRRRRDAGDERGGSRGVQDIVAEKEARASILDKDQPDTPYSEQNSQHPLHRGLGLAGRNESGVDLGIGQAISGGRNGSVRTESIHTITGGNDRNSAMYSSLGGAANSAHGTPVIGSGAFAGGHGSPRAQTHTPPMSVHDRSSAMGSPVPRPSSQLDRSLSPYRDNAGQLDYVQHHHHVVVDGADRVQQEYSNDSTARSPSSLYSNPLDELQPISPESARENDGAAGGGGGGGGGVASSQPPGHGRTNTPSGIAQQYAHLVEEGMTNDEIRRLEEEERALDEAIEAQAGTSGRQR